MNGLSERQTQKNLRTQQIACFAFVLHFPVPIPFVSLHSPRSIHVPTRLLAPTHGVFKNRPIV